MDQALPFAPQDFELLSIEKVSARLRTSRAFVRLCVDCGCPMRNRQLSAAEVLHWLFNAYSAVRDAAGLRPCPLVEDVLPPKVQRRLKMANAVLTIMEFGVRRSSYEEEKSQMRNVIKMIERSLDQA